MTRPLPAAPVLGLLGLATLAMLPAIGACRGGGRPASVVPTPEATSGVGNPTPSQAGATGNARAASTGPGAVPVTPRRPVVDEYHGTKVVDDYQWLENGADPEVRAWGDAESKLARAYLDAVAGRDALRARITSLLTDRSADWVALRTVRGKIFALEDRPPKQQLALVTLASADDLGSARMVVDPNVLDPKAATSIDFFVPSPDARLVAVSLSERGSESGTVRVYDVATGKEQGDVVPRVNKGTAGGSLAWAGDAKGFFYTRYPAPGERAPVDLDFYQQVWFHQLGAPEKDDRYAIGKDFLRIAETALTASEDGKYVLAKVQKGDGGEFAFFLHATSAPLDRWDRIADFEDGVKAAAFGHGDDLFLLSKKNAPRGKVIRVSRARPSLAADRATAVVPEGDAVVQQIETTASRLYVSEILGGPSRLRVLDPARGPASASDVPILPVSTVQEMHRAAGDDILFRNGGYLAPPAWYRFSPLVRDVKQSVRKTSLAQVSKVDFSDTEVLRETCTSKDGAAVPLTVMHKKGAPRDGSAPTLLTGYGGFNLSQSPRFQPLVRLWLDYGGVWAIANLRGGGELGEAWHDAGRLTKKQNVFDDFAACARHLVESNYTRPERLAAIGGSNGGLLMGAALTQHPEMFRAIVSHVGIYDMLRVELTPNGAFNVTEYGTVKDPEQFRALHGYSPYHHVVDGTRYPSVLFLTGANDPRVDPFHSRKMTARLQASLARGAGEGGRGNPVLLRTSGDTGHGMGTPLAKRIEESVDVFGFLFHELGMAVDAR